MGIEFVHQLLQKHDASGSKSTILKPLTWFISILVASLIGLLHARAPQWILIYIVVIVTIAVAIFFYTYLVCLNKNPDALRSETFTIQKMALEKGVYGDSFLGVYEVDGRKGLATTAKNSAVDKSDSKEE